MSFQDVTALPLKTFWSLYKQIDRLRAGEDLHSLSVPSFGATKEQFEKFVNNAQKTVGHPVVYDTRHETLDRKGLDRLRNLKYG